MAHELRTWTLGEIASLLGGDLRGPADMRITGPAPAGNGTETSLTFAGDARHLALAEQSGAGAVLVNLDADCSKPHIAVENPREAFGRFLATCVRELPFAAGIHPTAIVAPGAAVHESASIGPYCVVEEDVTIGAGVRIYSFCYVGTGCSLGEDVVLYPHAVLYQNVSVGRGTVIHSGTVIAADGFGYEWDGSTHVKLPQIGSVEIGEDVEIGALSAVDRAMLGSTIIGDNVKIDNLVQVAHQVSLGDHTLLASQVGIGGSTVVGRNVVMAGQVGVADHVSIGDGVSLAAGSATTVDVPGPGVFKGFPVRPLFTAQRIDLLTGRLPDMAKRLKDLERRLAELESKDE